CHTFDKGGQNRVGPNLWGVVGRERASEQGFNYTAAMKSHPGKWTFEELDKFLTNPRQDIPGTAMTFAGIQRDNQRADVIAYLRTLSDNPVPLPKVAQSPENPKSDAKGGDANGDAKGDSNSDAKGGDTKNDTKGGDTKGAAKGGDTKGGAKAGDKGGAKAGDKGGDTKGGAK
ncbi:MAG TPA: cytochrome c family protein, partial [Rhizomicrobium sp.]|nr:cytochrome c family protein [Rhizomicrobium sp.]